MDFVLPSDFASRPLDVPAIDFQALLNAEQFAAVTAPPGPLLVLAGAAGSGKTRTLTYRVAYLLSQGVKPGEILLLTFTNKAAKEMLHRVQDLTGIEPARFWGGTFHSLGNRALRMYGEAIQLPKNFTILDADESESLLKQTVEHADKLFFKDKTNPRPGPLFSVLSLARNTQLSLADTVAKNFPQYSDIAGRFPAFATAYAKAKRDQSVVDYDDLLELWLKLLTDAPEVAKYFAARFRHVLVDEYQDTNTIQAQIVDKLAAHHCVMAVGDDAQCIYSWRGADFENIMSFPERHPGTVIHRIEINYRSTPEILAFANGVLNAQPKGRHFDKELRAARKHSFLALEMQLALSRAGMPYQITSGVKFFERQHVRDLIALLRFVYNPSDAQAWQRIAILLPKVGEKGAQKIHAAALDHARLMQQNFIDALNTDDVKSKVAKDAKDDWSNFCASLRQVADAMSHEKPSDTVTVAIEGWYGDYLKGAYADYVDRLEELKALVGFAARFEEMQDLLAQIVLLNGETSDKHVDANEDAVKLTTVHQAKGLEYDVVFLIGAADGQFPGRRAIESGDVEEERRLFYVAVTRAKNELYISYPKVASRAGPGGMMLNPSRFLEELDENLYEELRIKRSYGW
ncbi:MAG: ATP-dependent helicase [Opitutaceae bacterium]|nr:ATP-dependent helicase [Opitutaceae bacterium]